MKKIIYSQNVLGIAHIWFSLHSQDKTLHDEFMKKIFELDHLEDITELFHHEKDFQFLQGANGFVVIDGKTYTFYTNQKEYDMRGDERFHEVAEEYNQKLSRPINLLYKDIAENRYPSMVITHWEDGSEHITFTD